MTLTAVLSALRSSSAGLTATDAQSRLARTGPNTIPTNPPASPWTVLPMQFRSVVTLLLVAALLIAAIAGDRGDVIAIGLVLVLNVALGWAVEIRAQRAVEALAQLEPRIGVVLRDGLREEVDARTVVPGDVLLIEEGQGIPADARLLSGEVQVNEAVLTGESVPVWKKAADDVPVDAALPERTSMVHAGTISVGGSARAIVVATGTATELGAIGRLVSTTTRRKTPLEVQLDVLGQQLVWVAILVAVATGVLAWIHGGTVPLVLKTAIALAVAAVPEGLPAVATATLALAVHRMARQHALVRRLPVVETLGSVTVLCSDKTGTLTAGEMTVTRIRTADTTFEISGTGYEPVGAFHIDGEAVDIRNHRDLEMALRIGTAAGRGHAVLTDNGWEPRGDPTEVALEVAATKAGIDRSDVIADMPEIAEVPFSSDRQFMATFHHDEVLGCVTAMVKGAPDRVLEMCWSVLRHDHCLPLDAPTRAALQRENAEMAARGLRVLALASGDVTHADEASLRGLTFVGLAALSDPPAGGVREAVDVFRRAGIRTVMITGDQRGTAEAIARDLGLGDHPRAIGGGELDGLSDDELERRLADASVFSRVSPAAKLRLISAYQRRGDVVAMIGDGVTDAAALKRADVGVTMGRRGTEVARETATIVLTDDRFDTIGVAIAEGRLVFENIRRFVFYLFSCNLAEIVVLLGASAAGLPLPLAPIQVLWLNVVTDSVPALALAIEPGRDDLMQRPPRPLADALLSRAFIRDIGIFAAFIAAPVLGAIAWQTATGIEPARAMTMNFAILGLAQLFHLGNARDEGPVLSRARALANKAALAALVVGALSVVAVVQIPAVATLLQLAPLTRSDWMLVVGLALLPAVAGQALKVARGRSGDRVA